MSRNNQILTLKNLTKSSVWDISESDVFRLWAQAGRDGDLKDNWHHYLDIIKCAFTVEEVKIDKPEVIAKYEARGCQVDEVRIDDSTSFKWAVKKKPILRITDLTWENIHHISARKVIEVLERNFGGGWESLPQSIQDIITSAFDISTTTLPAARLKKPGGLYEKNMADGYEVLEVAKGLWVEAIFVKEKPKVDVTKVKFDDLEDEYEEKPYNEDEDYGGDTDEEEKPRKRKSEDEDDDFDDDKLIEESYRTTFSANEDELDLQAGEVSDEDEF